MTEEDVVFVTHASHETGFGHAARCGHLAGLLCKRLPELRVVIEGSISDRARDLLSTLAPVRFVSDESTRARVGVYDRMDDHERPEVIDAKRFDRLCARSDYVLLMANGLSAPPVSERVSVIGYKPGAQKDDPPRVRWSLKYAPVARGLPNNNVMLRGPSRALVALGGANGADGLHRVLAALALRSEVQHVDVLDSPVNPLEPPTRLLRPDQVLRVHRSVPDVTQLLAEAGVVVASYGHLGYEALALGAPVCLVGQKCFQVEYANRLAGVGLCISAGKLDQLTREDLADAISLTMSRGDALSIAARRAIDGKGLDRSATVIEELLDRTT